MDQEEEQSTSVFRYKSPTFRNSETRLLLELIEKYKYPLLIKSTLFSVTHTKDKAWAKLTKEFNSLNAECEYERAIDVLKTKWDNLKRLARRSTKNNGEHRFDKFHSEILKNVIKICETDVGPMVEAEFEDENDSKELKFNNSSFDCKEEFKGLGDDDDSDSEKKKARPITSFSARDCRLLLHCVRQEKNVLFSNSPVVRKQKAWSRIARSFNRQSSTKRSPQELKKKFQNLKAMASRVNNAKKCFNIKTKSYEEMGNDNLQDKKIKFELKSESTEDMNFDNDDVEDCLDEGLIANSPAEINHDPLSNGITPEIGIGFLNHNENKEADKLKIQLLNYKLETAKLQRKRIEDAIESDKSERDLRALETSLRIRAARLEVMAAEMKLPPMHPALQFTPEETRAQQYLAYRNT